MASKAKGKRGRRIMDPQEREAFVAERREEERERIESAVRELATSEGWTNYVRTRSRFHHYSANNCLLIALQCPEASHVTGYRTWQGLGRQVRKGERGIRIMCPIATRVRKGEPASGGLSTFGSVAQQTAAGRESIYDAPEDRGEFVTRQAFRSVAVFDISQTTGEPLPELESEPITGDSLAEWLPKLVAFAQSIGFAVDERDLTDHAAGGWCNYAERLIVVDSSVPANAQVRVLVHELAHALGVSGREYGRDVAEVLVESAALIVCGTLGLDTSGESVPYIAGWAEGDPKALREHAATVDELATRIERGIGAKDAPEAKSDARELVAA